MRETEEDELQTELIAAGIAGALDHIAVGHVGRRSGECRNAVEQSATRWKPLWEPRIEGCWLRYI